jgi:hypothetical protein
MNTEKKTGANKNLVLLAAFFAIALGAVMMFF